MKVRLTIVAMGLVALMTAAAPVQADGGLPPLPPAAVQATPNATGGIDLQWQDPVYDGGAPVDHFRVYRDGLLLRDGIVGHTFTDPTGTSLSIYAVSAVNGDGEGAPAAALMGTTGCVTLDTPGPFPLPAWVVVDPWSCIGVVQQLSNTNVLQGHGIHLATPVGDINL